MSPKDSDGNDMIDRPSRDRLSAQLRRYMCGRITNWELDDTEDELKEDSDRAIAQIVWLTYSDIPKFRAVGVRRVDEGTRTTYERCILFLDSELEYEWPGWNPKGRPWFLWLRNWLSSGRAMREFCEAEAAEDQEWRNAGDVEVWPFIRRQDYEQALKTPRRLAEHGSESRAVPSDL